MISVSPAQVAVPWGCWSQQSDLVLPFSTRFTVQVEQQFYHPVTGFFIKIASGLVCK